jgi:phenylalanyl-tRNA synthetase beta chain
MLLNIDWLRDWVDFDWNAQRLADELTTAGLEVDGISSIVGGMSGVVVAEVLEVTPHPNADRLSVCVIDDGSSRQTVVCGAPNVAVGIRVPYAPVGARLPGGRTIDVAEVRGIVSDGMLCSARELELADDGGGLMILDADAPVGQALIAHLRLDDAVLDINITPNRGDCFSVLGVAREVAARLDQPLSNPGPNPIVETHADEHPVVLRAPDACPRFAGRVVRNIRTDARSPDWLKERLRRAGLRPIHPVVDVTNYVMLELGQPLHAYNLDALVGPISVRRANADEQFTLLDGKTITLATDVLVIADDAGPIGLAGIMGGQRASVTTATQDIFFESAFFAPEALRGRARRYGLHTDASMRFERGVDPTEQQRAIERATQLLQRIAEGRAGPTTVTEDQDHLPKRPSIELRSARIEAVLGLVLADEEIERLLRRLEMSLERQGEAWSVIPPAFRFDVAIEEDLIEEIGRMTGYDNIPAIPGANTASLGTATEERVSDAKITDVLTARGYTEIITYSFIDAESEAVINPGVDPVRVQNPISSDLSVMRRSLWPGLLRVVQQNSARQASRLRLFELGRQYATDPAGIAETGVVAGVAAGEQWPEQWDLPRRPVDFFDVKADLEALLALSGRAHEFEFLPGEHPALIPARTARISDGDVTIGWLGCVHPRVQKHFDLKDGAVLFSLQLDRTFAARIPVFTTYSKYPFVRRDLAVVVDETVSVTTLLEHVETAAGNLLKSARIFDVYRGQGIDTRRKSIGLGLILQDASRTLTDDDADRTVDSVVHRLEHELGATIRT